ncbi:MAG: peptide ABC transporter substrate-binding protein [Anaerolineales bacterium]|nr:peptide ABC transporter substrate-binding protein [Anaerolineales bacterium]
MFHRKWVIGFVIVMLAVLALSACQAPTPEVQTVVQTVVVQQTVVQTVVQQVEATVETVKEVVVTATPEAGEKVTLDINLSEDPATMDPSLVSDVNSAEVVDNLFLGLTNIGADGSVEPELATDWSVSDDRLTYTFTMRDDATWVRYTPSGGMEELGPVTAYDVVYGVRRTCDPRTGATYAYIDYIIAGCQELNTADLNGLSDDAMQALVDAVGVTAPDSYTVQFTVDTPAAYFPGIAGMWGNRPQYRAAIEEHGEHWTDPGYMVSNGPYTLVSWFHGDNMVLEKNPFWYGWADATGNIERIEIVMVPEEATGFALYETGELDTEGIPYAERERVQNDPELSQQYSRYPLACTTYVGFTDSKPPMDNVLVRRALSAAIDRQSLIDNITRDNRIPANAFAPAMIFGNAAGDTGIAPWTLPESMGGWGYEKALAQAREWLAEAGYPNGEGFPTISYLHVKAESASQIAQAIQAMWKEGLGIDMQIETQEGNVVLNTLQPTTPLTERPHTWYMGWCADYADENNWVHEVFNTDEGANWLSWDESANAPLGPDGKSFNQLTEEAQRSEDPVERQVLYRAAEKILVDDAAGFAPLYYPVGSVVTKPYLQRTYPTVGGNEWYTWVLDWDAKQEALGR